LIEFAGENIFKTDAEKKFNSKNTSWMDRSVLSMESVEHLQ
jgi:hypothetical protein